MKLYSVKGRLRKTYTTTVDMEIEAESEEDAMLVVQSMVENDELNRSGRWEDGPFIMCVQGEEEDDD